MISLYQCVQSALTQDSSFITIQEYNEICVRITDYMAFKNLCFADVSNYVKNLRKMEPTVGQVVDQIFKTWEKTDQKNSEDFFYAAMTNIYSQLLGTPLTAIHFQFVTGTMARQKYMPHLYSKSRFSPIIGQSVVEYTDTAQKTKDRFDNDPAPSSEEIGSNLFQLYREIRDQFYTISIDPAFGDCQYGIMPFVVPNVSDTSLDDSPFYEETNLYEYVTIYREAYRDFKVLIDLHDKWKDLKNREEHEDVNGELTTTGNALGQMNQSIIRNIYNCMMHIPYAYNDGFPVPNTPFKVYSK